MPHSSELWFLLFQKKKIIDILSWGSSNHLNMENRFMDIYWIFWTFFAIAGLQILKHPCHSIFSQYEFLPTCLEMCFMKRWEHVLGVYTLCTASQTALWSCSTEMKSCVKNSSAFKASLVFPLYRPASGQIANYPTGLTIAIVYTNFMVIWMFAA